VRLLAIAATCAAVMAGCDGASLKAIIEGLIVREQLGLIQEIAIHSSGDTLQMGDPGGEIAEALTHDFTIGKYEITNEQYGKFIADGGYADQQWWTNNGWADMNGIYSHPWDWAVAGWDDPNQPVSGVNWYEAVAFCNWRSTQEGLTPVYDKTGKADMKANGYRLPTEVEWEYAASKGAKGAAERMFPYGDIYDPSKQVDFSTATFTAVVGSKSPAGDTRQGVADMTGNVAEWCSDNDDLSPVPATNRYYFVDDSSAFTMRGGGIQDIAGATSTSHSSNPPGSQSDGYGFRVVRTLS
jgi:formylglycine-generating enzyme required for sulfatase activity